MKLNIYCMDRNSKEMKEKLSRYEKMESKWNEEREFYRKSITLMQEEITKCKALNATLLKKTKHKRTCSEDQMFIFNQTNISSYFPVMMVSKPVNWVPRANMRSHLDSVRALCWQGQFLLSGGDDCLLKIWERDKLRMTVREHLAPIYTICGDNETVFTAGVEGVVRQWSAASFAQQPRPTGELEAHEQPIWELAWNPISQRLVSSSADGSLKVLRPSHAQLEQQGHIFLNQDSPTSICYTSVQRIICGLSTSNKLAMVDLAKGGRCLDMGFQGKQACSQVNKVINWQNRGLIVSAHQDRVIRFFDCNSGKIVKTMVAHSDAVTSLSLRSPDTQQLYSTSHDNSFRAWDLREFRCISDVAVYMRKYDESALCLAYSQEEQLVGVGGADGQIKLLCPES